MDVATELYKSMIYVAQADYFYQAMASVTIIAMFIGSLLYNGDLNQLKKAMLTIFSYGGMISLTNVARIITSTAGVRRHLMADGQAFNGTTTVIYVTLFYMLGVGLGVLVHKRARNK